MRDPNIISETTPLAERLFLLLEDPSHLARYLSRLDPEARAGYPGDGRSCPLARFLNTMARAGAPLEVGAERVFLLESDTHNRLPVARLPYWAQEFVVKIDAGHQDANANPVHGPDNNGPGRDRHDGDGRLSAPTVRVFLDDVLLEALLY